MIKVIYILQAVLFATLLLVVTACSQSPQLPQLSAGATILAYGDSLTSGYGAAETESYPAQLAKLTGRKVVNAGIPGEISANGLKRLPELLENEHPALLILCHGGNDILQHLDQRQLAENLRAMIKLARGKGVGVVLVSVPMFGLSLDPPQLYEEIAKEFGAPLEKRVLKKVLGKRTLKSDQIHPNAAGYRMMAEALQKTLKKSGAL
ncbi:MAG: arylesterase [Geobacteraceae bacterium]|nr:arylesterase [Geobacteraceae bacterium]